MNRAALGVAAFAGCVVVLAAAPRTQQPRRDAKPRTTQSGVFSAAQAERGHELYLTLCQSCHAAATHTGPTFRRNWSGRSLAELYSFMSTRMPKSEPGSLAPETYADLLAYMLQLNQMPAGPTELAPDLAALKQVKIQLASTTRRKKT